jgi:5-formyltetrahydrofolate cyclo-ligase
MRAGPSGIVREDIAREKKALRERILGLRDALSAEGRQRMSGRIVGSILDLEGYRGARVVLAYMGFGSELATDALVAHGLAAGKAMVLPKVNPETRMLDLYLVRDPERDLCRGVWGIREPDPQRCAPASAEDIEFVLVPGVAFDAGGRRLGYGGGYYDRILARCGRALRVAGAFSVQLVEAVPVEPFDQLVDVVVTEEGSSKAPPR